MLTAVALALGLALMFVAVGRMFLAVRRTDQRIEGGDLRSRWRTATNPLSWSSNEQKLYSGRSTFVLLLIALAALAVAIASA